MPDKARGLLIHRIATLLGFEQKEKLTLISRRPLGDIKSAMISRVGEEAGQGLQWGRIVLVVDEERIIVAFLTP